MVVDKKKYDSKGRRISNVQNKEAAKARREAGLRSGGATKTITRVDGTVQDITNLNIERQKELAKPFEAKTAAFNKLKKQNIENQALGELVGGAGTVTGTTTEGGVSTVTGTTPQGNEPINLPTIQELQDQALAEPVGTEVFSARTQQLLDEQAGLNYPQRVNKAVTKDLAPNIAFAAVNIAGVVANVYDNLRALVSGGKTTRVKDAEFIYSQGTQAINAMIADAQAGRIVNESEAIKAFETAVSANAELQRTTKRAGVDNLRYWIRDGRALEVEAENNALELQRLRIKFFEALAQGQANNAAAQIGQ